MPGQLEIRDDSSTLALVCVHACVVVGAPLVASVVFCMRAYGVADLLSLDGLSHFGLILIPAYLLMGIPAVFGVVLGSPLAWAFSRLRHQVWASLLAALGCGGVGWALGMVVTYAGSEEVLSDVRAGAVVAGVIGGAVLEYAWRKYTCSQELRSPGSEGPHRGAS